MNTDSNVRLPRTARISATALAAAISLVAMPAMAQQARPGVVPDENTTEDTDQTATTLDTVVVKGQSLRLSDSAFSTTTVTGQDIKNRRVTQVDELFRDVPGMNLQDFGLGGVASNTVIRGFGGGGHGGDLGVVVDGIPLNESNSQSDGYVDVNVLVPLEIAALTVYRGPVSALYGNFNRGGLVAFETRKAGQYREFDLSYGSFQSYDAQAAFGATVGDRHQFNAAAQSVHSDGFRPQSDLDRNTMAARYAFAVSDSVDLAISGRVNNTEADNASYVTAAQYAVDPYGIDPRVLNDGLSKDFATLRADLNFTLSPDLRLLTFAYGTQQDFTRYFTRGAPAPTARWRQREETFLRDVYGAGASLNGQGSMFGRPVTFVAGLEGFSESTDFIYYEDLDRRRRANPAEYDRDLTLDSASLFGEANLDLHRLLNLSLGVRADRFTGDCRRLGPETTADACSELEALSNVSPKIAARSQVLPWLQLRSSYAEGFALPSGSAKYAPGAQSLEPNIIRQVEAGALFTPLDNLQFDVVGYRVQSSQEFAAIAPGEFQNFGSTRRTGVEASLQWQPVETVELRAVYAYADSEVRQNRNPALLGKRVTAVPDHTATLSAAWTPTDALRLDATYSYVGEYAVNPLNTLKAEKYELLDLGASYALRTPMPVSLYLKIENVTDKVYSPSVNTIGFATGSPRSIRAGLRIGF